APVQGDLFAGEEAFPFGANAPPAEAATEAPAEPAPAPPAKGGWQADYRLVDTQEAFKALLAELKQQKRFAIDLETTSLSPLEADVVGIALCWREGVAHYLPLRGPAGPRLLPAKSTLAKLRPILEDPAVAKVNQNIKYDLLVLRAHGIRVAG